MDVENGSSSLLSKARCCTSCISLFQKWFSSDSGQFYFFFFLNLLALSDLLSDIYVTIIYFQKQYFIFAICSVGFLALPALITAVFCAISFADDECDLSIGFQILIGWAFCLIWPVLVVIRPCVTSSELPFESDLSKNYKFICCFLESIPQFTINVLFLYHEKSLNIANLISLGCSGSMILYGIISGCLNWRDFNFRDLAFDLEYENDGS